MKKIYDITRLIAVITIFILILSCNNETLDSIQYGSMVAIANNNVRTIQPKADELSFSEYRIYGNHNTLNEVTIDKRFTTKSIKIDKLAVGKWTFTVEGYNNNGVLLAKSDPQAVDIEFNGIANTSYKLNWLDDGEGTFKLSIKVQSSRVARVECEVSKTGNNEERDKLTISTPSLQDDGLYLFEQDFTLPTGSYDASIAMKDDSGNQIGTVLHQAIHIYKELESKYEFSFEKLSNLISVDSPSASIATGETIKCNETISLETKEKDTDIYYSFDGTTYSEYSSPIDITSVVSDKASLTLYTYAEKTNMLKSDVKAYKYSIEHIYDEPKYTWTEIPTGYECNGTINCSLHPSYTILTETVTANSSIIKDSTCTEKGIEEFSAVFTNANLSKQTKELTILKKDHDYSSMMVDDKYVVSYATCTDKGVYYKSCNGCGSALTSSTFETEPLGHDYVDYKCTRCSLWGIGPAGGYVFYDCDADNTEEKPRGDDDLLSTECGWRFLEAKAGDLNDQYASNGKYVFGYYKENSSTTMVGTSTSIGSGKKNTDDFTTKMGDKALLYYYDTKTVVYAAKACSNCVTQYRNETHSGWFIPSKDELNLMYENLYKNGLGYFSSYLYWSSSEVDGYKAWCQSFDDNNPGTQYDCYGRQNKYYVRPIRAFLIQQ